MDIPPPGFQGLDAGEALRRLEARRRAEGHTPRWLLRVRLFLSQLRSPFVLLLLGAMGVSFLLGDRGEALAMAVILFASASLGFWQESRARSAVEALAKRTAAKSSVLRGGVLLEIPAREVVDGDLVDLKAGDLVPGDGVLLESRDLHIDEAALTGESFPAEKSAGAQGMEGSVRAGTHVVGGFGRAAILRTGGGTEFGSMAVSLGPGKPETDFERGLNRFGGLLLESTLVFVAAVFAINAAAGRPAGESLLFTLALAVGMAPELLPAITTAALARGALAMSREDVVVKRPAAIESFGGMTVLCADKTGTVTEGRMSLHAALDPAGRPSGRVLFLAAMNSRFESGFPNPIDNALKNLCAGELEGWAKLGEVPYGFLRRRLSILASPGGRLPGALVSMKGAVPNVLACCASVRAAGGTEGIGSSRPGIESVFARLSAQGKRVVGVASREFPAGEPFSAAAETGMVFEGFIVFGDPPRADAAAMVGRLSALGVDFKIITGDNRFVARSIARSLGIPRPVVLTGGGIRRMKEGALAKKAAAAHVFAEMEPDQKERAILALKRSGAVVGFIGDGINDAPALHAADVAISVDGAADIAREAADIVLLRHSLAVVERGICNGRATMANTLKYLRITTSANFGNMFSMAAAALFLPFLPLLPAQILLNNLLSDLPALALSTDAVDAGSVRRPLCWDIRRLGAFMAVFGIASSVFDMAAFAVFFRLPGTGEAEFQTLWFAESLLTEVLVVLVLRTSRPFLSSKPSRWVGLSVAFVALAALLVPVSGWPGFLGFVPVSPVGIGAVAGIALVYLAATEAMKRLPAGFLRI